MTSTNNEAGFAVDTREPAGTEALPKYTATRTAGMGELRATISRLLGAGFTVSVTETDVVQIQLVLSLFAEEPIGRELDFVRGVEPAAARALVEVKAKPHRRPRDWRMGGGR